MLAQPLRVTAILRRWPGTWTANAGDTHTVSALSSNGWGLYDASGNVWESVPDDAFEEYDPQPTVDPFGPVSSTKRIVRGGGVELQREIRSLGRT